MCIRDSAEADTKAPEGRKIPPELLDGITALGYTHFFNPRCDTKLVCQSRPTLQPDTTTAAGDINGTKAAGFTREER